MKLEFDLSVTAVKREWFADFVAEMVTFIEGVRFKEDGTIDPASIPTSSDSSTVLVKGTHLQPGALYSTPTLIEPAAPRDPDRLTLQVVRWTPRNVEVVVGDAGAQNLFHIDRNDPCGIRTARFEPAPVVDAEVLPVQGALDVWKLFDDASVQPDLLQCQGKNRQGSFEATVSLMGGDEDTWKLHATITLEFLGVEGRFVRALSPVSRPIAQWMMRKQFRNYASWFSDEIERVRTRPAREAALELFSL